MQGLVEWLRYLIGQVGQTQGDLTGHCHYIPKPGHVGPPWCNQNSSVAGVVL